jgi:steroid delta-isomerase-like uncharacterized protein
MSASHKALVRRFVEGVVNRGDGELLFDLVAPDHVRHASDGDVYGPEGVRIDLAEWRGAFPDLEVAIEDLVAEGNRVATRFVLRGTHRGPFLALPATGRAVEVGGVEVHRVGGGRLAESWVSLDGFALLRQLGRLT